MNIIADVAGEFDALVRLLGKMPMEKTIFVGDLNDRGQKSKEVIELVKSTQEFICLQSNHGDMFTDFYDTHMSGKRDSCYSPTDFGSNGGYSTLSSYLGKTVQNYDDMMAALKLIPLAHIEWLKNLPFYHQEDGLFVSHAAWSSRFTLEQACIVNDFSLLESSIIWTREQPVKRDGMFQVMGHNSHWGLKVFEGWGICIDQSRKSILTGFQWPSGEVFEEPY